MNRLTSPEAIKRAVIAGLGVAIISRLAIRCELQIGSLAVIPVKDLADSPAVAFTKSTG